MKIKIIKTCRDCEYLSNTGTWHNTCYICKHRAVRKDINKLDLKYWNEYPVLAKMSVPKLEIPSWCPLEDYRENKSPRK